MPTLNIEARADISKAKQQLYQLNREIKNISDSEKIMGKSLARTGDVSAKQFKAMQSAAVRQARAVNSSSVQFKQLKAQIERLGASTQIVGKLTREFRKFKTTMESGTVSTQKMQQAQDRLRATFGHVRRAAAKTAAATEKARKPILNFGGTLENLGSTAVLVAGPLSGIGSRIIALGAIAKRGSLAIALGFGAIAGAATLATASIKRFGELEVSLAKIGAILRATGKDAQFTAEQINAIASDVALNTLTNPEEARGAAGLLLSFKGINKNNLKEILELSQDIAATGFTDLGNAAKTLGRAAEDPLKNMDALRRIFIQLSIKEKEQIKTLSNLGLKMEAFGIITDKIKEKFGGSGRAANVGLAGAVDALGQRWTEFLEIVGDTKINKFAIAGINKLKQALEGLGGVLQRFFGKDTMKELKDSFTSFEEFAKIFEGTARGEAYSMVTKEIADNMEKMKKEQEAKVSKISLNEPSGIERTPAMQDLVKEFDKQTIAIVLAKNGIDSLSTGYATIAPQVLSVAAKHGILSETLRYLTGDLAGFKEETLRTMRWVGKLNDTLIHQEQVLAGLTVWESTRKPIEKYAHEIQRLNVLQRAGVINAEMLKRATHGLQTTYADAWPLLQSFNSALDTFGSSIESAFDKGELSVNSFKQALSDLAKEMAKDVFKLGVLNPVKNAIFGTDSATFDPIATAKGLMQGEGFRGGSEEAAANWLGSLEGTNREYENKGTQAANTFGENFDIMNTGFGSIISTGMAALKDIFSSLFSGGGGGGGGLGGLFSSLLGGGGGSAAGAGAFTALSGAHGVGAMGFAHGGEFKVGGAGGQDSKMVSFKASPSETVSVKTPQQQKGSMGGTYYIDARGADQSAIARLERTIRELNGSIESRAMQAVSEARQRNPDFFGTRTAYGT